MPEQAITVPDEHSAIPEALLLGVDPDSLFLLSPNMVPEIALPGVTVSTGTYHVKTTTGGWADLGPFTSGPTTGSCQYHTDFQTAIDANGYAHCVFEAHHYDLDPAAQCLDAQDLFIGYKSQMDGTWTPGADPYVVSDSTFGVPCDNDSVPCPSAGSPGMVLSGNKLHVFWHEADPDDPEQKLEAWHRSRDLTTGTWSNRTKVGNEEPFGNANFNFGGFVVDPYQNIHVFGWNKKQGSAEAVPDTVIQWHRVGVPPAGAKARWSYASDPDTVDTFVIRDGADPVCWPGGGGSAEDDDLEGVAVLGSAAGLQGGFLIYKAWDRRAECRKWARDTAFATLHVLSDSSYSWSPTTMLTDVDDEWEARIGGIAADDAGIHFVWHEVDPVANFQLSERIFHRFTPDLSPADSTAWTSPVEIFPASEAQGLFRPRPLLRDGVLHVAYARREDLNLGWRFDVYHRERHVLPDTAGVDMTLDGAVLLDGDFTIPDGVTVTIAPGTTVSVAPGDRLAGGLDTERSEIIVEDGGRLIAAGTSSQPIVIRSTLPDSGLVADSLYWGGIHLLTYASAQTGYGYVCCGGSTACEGEDGIPYASLCDAEKTEFDHVTISGATYGISIDRNIAPEIRNTSFTNILGDRDIYLRNGDAVLPVDFTWDLLAPTNVVANDAGSVPDSLEHAYGTDGKRDLVLEGSLITSSASPGAVVSFRSESRNTGTGDDWGGAVLLPSGAVRSIQDADFAYAANPLFVYYADSTLVLRRSSIHHFEDVGLWMKGDFGTGLVVGDSLTIYRGEGLLTNRGRRGVYLDGTDKLTFRGNSVSIDANNIGAPVAISKAIEVYFGKTACMTQGGSSRMLSIDGNVLAGPGLHTDPSESGFVRGIYSDWVCGGSYRDVEYTNNLIQDFDLHGMEFYQSSDIQVGCNTLADNWQSVEHRRDSEPTGAGVRFRSNVFSTPAGPKQMVRTDNALKTKLGGTGDKGNNRFWTNGVDEEYPRFLMEDEPGNTHVALDASKCGWFADSTRITSPAFIDTSKFVWTTLIPDSLEGSGDPDEPKVNVSNPNTASVDDCGGSARPGQRTWSAVAPAQEEEPMGAPIADVPTVTSIGPPFPNPSRGTITVDLAISADHAGHYRVRLYDVGGRLVGTMMDREVTAGRYRVDWSTRLARGSIAPGVYFVRTTGPGVERNSKLVVLR